MKFTQVLCRHNIGRMLRNTWFVKSQRKIQIAEAESILASQNIEIKDALDIVNPKPVKTITYNFDQLVPEVKFDNTHPDWKDKICWTYKDHNVLQAGVLQALLLTKSIQMSNELPEQITKTTVDYPDSVNDLVKRSIYTSTIFDAYQTKLPKIKDSNKPGWNFPRVYGISTIRKTRNVTQKLLQLCESLCGPNVSKDRFLVHDGIMSFLIEKDEDLLQFTLRMDIIVTSKKALEPIASIDAGVNKELPDIYPLHPIISLEKANIYKNEILYPLNISETSNFNLHTIFVHHDTEEVKNLTELPVQDDQIYARSLVKSFTAAATYALQKYGPKVKDLPKPIVVKCVQSNACNFHFSVFQLNTLDINGMEGVKNLWWSLPTIKLYEKAQYEEGRPVLAGYNPEIFKLMYTFYRNN